MRLAHDEAGGNVVSQSSSYKNIPSLNAAQLLIQLRSRFSSRLLRKMCRYPSGTNVKKSATASMHEQHLIVRTGSEIRLGFQDTDFPFLPRHTPSGSCRTRGTLCARAC